ncbi:MAG TPA: hypothetical protein VMT18_12585 [Planctomycetota bacterium]|nr:hypothetical protein [Planctomycetota bacterium]
MKRLLSLAVAAAALALLPACLISRDTLNEPLAGEAAAKLAPGATTAAQAIEILGAPNQVVQLGFRSAYYYEFTTAKRAALFLFVIYLSNTDARQDRLWLFFDDKDVLTHFGATYEAAGAQYILPWSKPD